ncbi:protein FAR-RED IMPAIRED RESPONSE 1-like [Apium graveolens]|uniref:protein FAR-RED IMPAIRED RESPONSE 1-like n=1 Tax=Apium graveolens TaxID=4045 RepID=UPI003D7BB3B6
MYDGYANVGASLQDFWNFNKDAQMMIDKFKRIQDKSKSFYYSCDVDSDGRLTKLFWANSIGRRNFELYGDSISFDAIFDTNRYNLIFALFTSVDKHDRCVFVRDIFSNVNSLIRSKHRLCVWHIMEKFPVKLGNRLCKETDFMEKMRTYIWSSIIETEENEPIFGLLRTTSRSESENLFLGSFINKEIRYMNFGCILRVQWTSKGMRQLDWIEEILTSCLEMQIKRMSEEVDGVTYFKIRDVRVKDKLLKVSVSMNHVVCSCKKFVICVDKVGVEMDRLEHVHSTMKKLNTELDAYDGSIVSFMKKGHIAAMVGQQPEGEVHILPPNVCKNKGNYFKRLMSDRFSLENILYVLARDL